MPSFSSITRKSAPSVLEVNNQGASITLPPLMKCATAGAAADSAADVEVLPAKANTSYVIHAVVVAAVNTALSAGTYNCVAIKDFETGVEKYPFIADVTAGAASNDRNIITGLNLPLMPGTSVKMMADDTVHTRNCIVYYSEVEVV